jgi:hypothetical protein
MRRAAPILLACLFSFATASHAATRTCAQLTKLKIPNVAMAITKAQQVAAGPLPSAGNAPTPQRVVVPAHCRIDGVIDERIGRNGKPYAIGFAISLPDEWNGRFVFQGGGGLNGVVRPPIGSDASGDMSALARGYAVVSTDSGHRSAAVFDASFFEDQEATLNFLYQAIGKVAPAAKQIVAQRYGKDAQRSYYVGCSTGGREAMMVSQRYPTYFDGIVAGAPAMRTNYSDLADRWVLAAFNAIAPKDEAGKPLGARAFSDGDRQLIVSSLLKACDAGDGLADGMIFAPQDCRFDPATLACEGAKTDACLTSEQTSALRKAFAGPQDSRGQQVYPGFFYDTGIAAGGQGGIPGLLMAAPTPVTPPDFGSRIDVDAEALAAANANSAAGDTDRWTNLTTFANRGGKLLFYHGVSDPWFSAVDTVQYYERLAKDNGGIAEVSRWSRLFLVPGMGHCRGGAAALDRFDMLGAVADWVEKGAAPAAVIATGAAFPGRSRPLCPYPQHAHYKGEGDAQSAASFECR